MQNSRTNSLELKDLFASEARAFCVGQIVQLTPEGQALVDYPGNPGEPVLARSVVSAPPTGDDDLHQGTAVLLLFEHGDPALPIIVGMVRNALYPPVPHNEVTLISEKPRDVVVDGKKMVFDAKEEIVLRCGKSSVTLHKNGKIVVKGAQLVSRASGTNKIKGASVSIN